jgi:hypothetical protein
LRPGEIEYWFDEAEVVIAEARLAACHAAHYPWLNYEDREKMTKSWRETVDAQRERIFDAMPYLRKQMEEDRTREQVANLAELRALLGGTP